MLNHIDYHGISELAVGLSVGHRDPELRERLGEHVVARTSEERPFDIPWMVLDATLARDTWGWAPLRSTDQILDEILVHAREHPQWLEMSNA